MPIKIEEKDVTKKKMGKRVRDLSLFVSEAFDIIEYVGVCKKQSIWKVRCKKCGEVCLQTGSYIVKQATKSCGCLCKKHGGSGTKLYEKWASMRKRCSSAGGNKNSYKHYYTRGIRVCDEWKNSYSAFRDWALKSGYEEGLTIDRIDNDGNYCPENCRWATVKQQNRNKRGNILITIGGKTSTLGEWAEISGINYTTLNSRHSLYKWEDERLLDKQKNETKYATVNGETKTVAEWSKISGIKYATLLWRVNNPEYFNGDFLDPPVPIGKYERKPENRHDVTINNITRPLVEWARISNIKYRTLLRRLNSPTWPNEHLLLPVGTDIKKWLKDKELKNS